MYQAFMEEKADRQKSWKNYDRNLLFLHLRKLSRRA
jgi:hypothetical protein